MKSGMHKKILGVLVTAGVLVLVSVAVADEQSPFVYDDHGRRNPFLPLVSNSGMVINYDQELQMSDMVLEGVFMGSAGENLAIINGNIVQKNDKIDKYVIIKIEKTSVTVKKGDEEFVLRLRVE